MFSQLRSAVEQLAQQQPVLRPQRASSPAIQDNDGTRRSLSNASSTSHLAESALLNLRKTLSNQRAGLVSNTTQPPPPPPPSSESINSEPKAEHVHKPTRGLSLEDRLRASFAGELPSITLGSERREPPNPIDIPLPLSPILEPTYASERAFADPLTSAPVLPSQDSILPSPAPPVSIEAATFILPPKVAEQPFKDPLSPAPLPREFIPRSPTPSLVLESLPSPLPELPDSYLQDGDSERMKARVKLVERRFADVSTSFKRLQAEKLAADLVLRDLTPLESITDAQGLRDYLHNLKLKTEISAEEIKSLHARLRQHDERLEEVRDMHRLESASQSEQVEKLRTQLDAAQKVIQTALSTGPSAEQDARKHKAEVEELRKEVEKSQGLAKEEEEKRVKAVSLLKTMRQKVVKAEKDKDDLAKELAVLKERETADKEKEKIELAKLDAEVTRIRTEREKDFTGLRAQFSRDLAAAREGHEKEATARKAQYELDIITTKAAHTKELTSKTSLISQLESSNRTLVQEKDILFDDLQQRQAELESSQSHLQSLQGQVSELEYQLREMTDKVASLQDDLSQSHPTEKSSNGIIPLEPRDDLARILSDTQGKYEARLSELRMKMRALEKERSEAEEEWGRNLQERSREVERLRRVLDDKDKEYAESVRTRKERDEKIEELEQADMRNQEDRKLNQIVLSNLRKEADRTQENQVVANQEKVELLARVEAVERQIEEAKSREAQLRANNKTLREEIRKVQSSAALLEKQRNPGVGYWSNTSPRGTAFQVNSDMSAASLSNLDLSSTASGSPRPATPNPEEEINLEYLRNVILQFLEHKDMRPNLVRVLSTILHFTPQETRRLVAKV